MQIKNHNDNLKFGMQLKLKGKLRKQVNRAALSRNTIKRLTAIRDCVMSIDTTTTPVIAELKHGFGWNQYNLSLKVGDVKQTIPVTYRGKTANGHCHYHIPFSDVKAAAKKLSPVAVDIEKQCKYEAEIHELKAKEYQKNCLSLLQ